MAKKYENFQPQQTPDNPDSIGGIANFTAVRGNIVVPKGDGTNEVELADGQAGYFLDRDVKSEADITAIVKANEVPTVGQFGNEFEMPYQEGNAAQAKVFPAVWVEGSDLIHDLDENTTVDTQVTTNAGKIAELTDSEDQESMGVVRAIEPAKNAAAPAKRFLIAVMRKPVNIPAV